MSSATSLTCTLPDAASMGAFARSLAPFVRPGDVFLLSGSVGAGKTAFARALIGALRGNANLPHEDVPSPTFTLVQTYDVGPFEVWHADLYRLSGPDGVVELGLDDAFETALCLIEWPDRLGADAPADALHMTLTVDPEETRQLILRGPAAPLARLSPAFPKVPV